MHIAKATNPVRFGVLSAAAINPTALFAPIRTCPDAIVVAVSARNLAKAQAQAKKFGIPNAYGSYDELLAQSNIDAVYIPLPNGLHCEWAIKSMRAGKHVLIEKPIASNADEVRQILQVSQETGKVALEAYHWQFHPAAHVVKSLVESGRYGHLLSTEVSLPLPGGVLAKDDIRFKYEKLAGGACMDLGYVFSATRYFVGSSDYEISKAVPRIHSGDRKIDEAMRADLIFHMSDGKPDVKSTVIADLAESKFLGIIPQIWHPQYAKLELEKATVTFEGYVPCSTF
jgi:predicted dehydrogenase